jgi:hypothetical protein
MLDEVLTKSYSDHLSIIKVHSHPNGFGQFSNLDTESDRSLFASVSSLMADGLPHASTVMMPDGSMFGRVLLDGEVEGSISLIMTAGDNIRLWRPHQLASRTDAFAVRHSQVFGAGTVSLLKDLSVAVIGCSGTGSIVVEQLTRLGVGRLVLVDPDVVEEKNLNRILNSGKEDAYLSTPKVNVLASAIAKIGLGTEVIPLQMNLATRHAIDAVAECDVVFSCMDGVEGRHLLNRLATFYTIPFFDVGVKLDADGLGGVENISGAVHYVQPGGSILLSRGVYSMEQVDAEAMRRIDPGEYRRQVGEGYLRGVVENRPAVISVNGFYASLCVNEFLARIHPYRNNPNASYAYTGASLTEVQFYLEGDGDPDLILSDLVGKGDVLPPLDRPSLS